MSGLMARMSSTSMRNLVRMGARFEVTKTSAVRTMAASAARQVLVVRSQVTLRLPRLGISMNGLGPARAEIEHVEQSPLGVAVRRLDLYDVGAQVRQHGAGRRHEGPVGDLDDADSTQRASHDVPHLLLCEMGTPYWRWCGGTSPARRATRCRPRSVGVIAQVGGHRQDIQAARRGLRGGRRRRRCGLRWRGRCAVR